ncbi:MAG TPA: oligopeptide/dipeptide ABC transporter ATP-binding protein, partial [Actinopolymorphaceae bacterium]
DGEVELLGAPERVLARTVRGRRIALVPQSAHSALTPTRTARALLSETVRRLEPTANVAERLRQLCERVGLDEGALDRYAHELSGGMAQRVVLALALSGRPEVIVADEPTTGLDRPLADRAATALRELADDGMAVLLITHDLRIVERVATDIAVMYASRLVEHGPAADILTDPWHTYTQDLFGALPSRGFMAIPGHPPDLTRLPSGCAYAERSAEHRAHCSGDLALDGTGERRVACGMRPGIGSAAVGRAVGQARAW